MTDCGAAAATYARGQSVVRVRTAQGTLLPVTRAGKHRRSRPGDDSLCRHVLCSCLNDLSPDRVTTVAGAQGCMTTSRGGSRCPTSTNRGMQAGQHALQLRVGTVVADLDGLARRRVQ